MKEIRLIKILKSFTKEELIDFRKYIQSPLFRGKRDTIPLFNLLAKHHPDYSSLEKEEISKKLFGKASADNTGQLENFIQMLTKSAESFLIYLTLKKDKAGEMLLLSIGYFERNIFDESNRLNNQIKLTPSFSPDKDYLFKLKQLAYMKFKYFETIKEHDKSYDCVEKIFEASALQFIFEYYQFLSNMKIAENHFNIKIKNTFVLSIIKNFKKILESLEIDEFINKTENKNFLLYYYQFKTQEEPQHYIYYDKLKELLINSISDLEREDRWFLHIHLINYANARWNSNEGLGKDLLKISKSMMKSKSFSHSENQPLDRLLYRNMVLYSSVNKDSKFLEELINKYSVHLHPEFKESYVKFAQSYYHFLKGNFKESLKTILSIKYFEHPILKIDVRNFSLKIYYELNDFNEAFLSVDAYRHFLDSTKEIDENFKQPCRTFINLCNELLKIKSGDSKDVHWLKTRIEKEALSGFKPWLLEKADELIRVFNNK